MNEANLQAKIIGTGACVPDTIITNKELEKMVDTSDEWIVSRTGIRERRRTHKDEAVSIPITLDEAVKNKRIKNGDIVLMTAFGSGLTWGASLIRW